MTQRLMICIGGAPGVGKSTFARTLLRDSTTGPSCSVPALHRSPREPPHPDDGRLPRPLRCGGVPGGGGGDSALATESTVIVEFDDVYDRTVAATAVDSSATPLCDTDVGPKSGTFDPMAWRRSHELFVAEVRVALHAPLPARCSDENVAQLVLVVDTLHYRSMRHDFLTEVRKCNAAAVAGVPSGGSGAAASCGFASIVLHADVNFCLENNERGRLGTHRYVIPDVLRRIHGGVEPGPCRGQPAAQHVDLVVSGDLNVDVSMFQAVVASFRSARYEGTWLLPTVSAAAAPSSRSEGATSVMQAVDIALRAAVKALLTSAGKQPVFGDALARLKKDVLQRARHHWATGDLTGPEALVHWALGELEGSARRFVC